MTTLDKTALEAARKTLFLHSTVMIAEYVTAYLDALSSIPEQGVGVEWPEPTIINPDIAQPTGIPYLDSLIHRVLDAQQDINFAANEQMSQPLADASALMDEVETAIRKFSAAPSHPAAVAVTDDMVERATADVVAATKELSADFPLEPALSKLEIAVGALAALVDRDRVK